MLRFRTLLAVSLLEWSAAMLAAPPRPITNDFTIEQYEVRDGLAHSTTSAIAQTPDGYLWFGTQEGLSRFDGVRFTNYDHVSTPILNDSFIQTLATSKDGALLVGTGGSGITKNYRGRWESIAPDVQTTRDISSVAVAPDGTIWAGTIHGLFAIRGKSVRRYGREDGLGATDVRALLIERDGTVWVSTLHGGVSRIRNGDVRTYTTKGGMLPSNDVLAIAHGPDGTILVGAGGSLTSFSGEQVTHRPLGIRSPDSEVQAIAFDAHGRLWVGTSGDGLLLVEKDAIRRLPDTSPITNVSALTVDRDNALWVGTRGWGIQCVRERRIAAISTPEGLSSPVAWSMLESRDASIWIGTDGGLDRFDSTLTLRAHYGKREGFSTDASTTLCEGPDGSIWSGGEDGQLRRIAPDGSITTLELGKADEDRVIRSLTLGSHGILWVATGNGLYRILSKDGTVSCRYTGGDGLPSSNVRATAEGPDGTLWITTSGGLSSFRDGAFTTYTTRESLESDFFFAVTVDSEGLVWLAARTTGVAILREGKISRITTEQGLYHNAIYSILEDPEGSMWFTSSRGVARARRSDIIRVINGEAQSFTGIVLAESAGMRNRECNGGRAPAIWRMRDGRILTPTMDGVAIIPPHSAVTPRLHVAPIIEEVRDSTVTRHHVPFTFEPGDGRISVRFTAPTFFDPTQIRFRYRLDGFDAHWVESGEHRQASYTNLPPGTYTFRVEIVPPTGEPLASDEANITITLLPHLYQTSAARAVAICLALVAISLGVRLRTRQLVMRKQELEHKVQEQTAELRESHVKLEHKSADLLRANIRLEEQRDQLQRLSRLDALTGIGNRRSFDERLHWEWSRASREKKPLSLLLIDVDYFKAFNDAAGHQAGDDCLQRIATCLGGGLMRGSDTVSRYGGEEFVVVLPSTNAAGAKLVAERLRERVRSLCLRHPNPPFDPRTKTPLVSEFVTVSIGVATTEPQNNQDESVIVSLADEALYAAKNSGRNCTVASQTPKDTLAES